MNKVTMNLLQVGDKVRIGTRKEFEAYKEAGGRDLLLLDCSNVPFGEVGEIRAVTPEGNSNVVFEDWEQLRSFYYYPEEMLFLI